jgi:hypothetical protein
MEKHIGTASNVIYSFVPAGEGSGGWHTTDFRIDGQSVHIATGLRSTIRDGDRIVAAGTVRNGELVALAYKNLTMQTDGDSGQVVCLLAGTSLLFVAALATPTSVLIATLVVTLASCLLVRFARIREAARIVALWS